jgi:hypothetical protein
METPVHLDFQGKNADAAIRESDLKHIAGLEERFARITACRVVVKAPSEHHRNISVCRRAARSISAAPRPKTSAMRTSPSRSTMPSSEPANGFRTMPGGQGHVKTHDHEPTATVN